MENTNKTVLVTGATGRQGGAVIRYLLRNEWKLRALTRNPNAPAAQELTRQGVEVMQGDLEDPASLDRAAGGVYGVYSVQDFWSVGAKREVARARTWWRPPGKLVWNTSSTVPWAGRSGTPASIIGRASGRLRSIFASSACQPQYSGQLLSWRTTTSIRLKSEF